MCFFKKSRSSTPNETTPLTRVSHFVENPGVYLNRKHIALLMVVSFLILCIVFSPELYENRKDLKECLEKYKNSEADCVDHQYRYNSSLALEGLFLSLALLASIYPVVLGCVQRCQDRRRGDKLINATNAEIHRENSLGL